MAIFILAIFDYILTYIGISSGVISEGNPLLVFLFENGFIYGLIFRISYSAIILTLLYRIRKYDVQNYILVNIALGAVYLLVFLRHLQWIMSL